MQQYEYDFIDDETFSYFFKTTFQVFYKIEFKPTGYIFGEEYIWSHYCYEFSIKLSANSPKNTPFDPLVSITIASIFVDFFKNKQNIIIYTCDTSDGKHLVRVRKFDRWFNQFNHEKFLKIDNSIVDSKQNTTYYNSLIIRQDNPYKDEIVEAFEDLIGGFEEDK
ncbi:hypothetical protein LV89_02591 [Arcicella aurantiaca]|uniref:Uncharacterized protein n=1 Tax=Arcicella aurantiaca TaxID=591202 RepID=A0A316ETC1_9BACT|nr:DUF6169 family protein [Arcicella aurantiaca]PWK26420.1 hypothetical protein LV89_02591 [Arcicella aurantiaca]